MNAIISLVFIGLGWPILSAQQVPSPKWEIQESGTKASIRGLHAVSASVAWFTGSGGTWSKTLNGGKTWQTQVMSGGEALDFRDVFALSGERAVLMSAGEGNRSRIYTTNDGGTTWQLRYQIKEPKGFLNGMAFWDAKRGIAVGDPIQGQLFLLLTEDGGDHWRRLKHEAVPKLEKGEYGFAASGTGIAVGARDRIWVVTGGIQSRLLMSDDLGQSWQSVALPLKSGLASTGAFSIHFADASLGMVAGGDYAKEEDPGATLALTQNGGRTWQLADAAEKLPFLSCIAPIPAKSKWIAVGPAGSHLGRGDGTNWRAIQGPGFHTLSVAKEGQAVWAAGAEGKVGKLRIPKP